jgi:hypothetical protein
LIDEFRGAPSRVNSTLKEQGYPLRIGGEPMVTVEQEKTADRVKKTEEKQDEKDKAKKK